MRSSKNKNTYEKDEILVFSSYSFNKYAKFVIYISAGERGYCLFCSH